MKRDGKLLIALHILAHLAVAPVRPLTSAALAVCLCTNPVVIRRALAGLREAGIVTSAKGHGGGWTVARPPATISLREVYVALGERIDLAPVRGSAGSGCLIEATVARALDGFSAEAEALLLRRLDTISLADLAAGFHQRLIEQTGSSHVMSAPAE
ncbi:MAG: Rrf2 family transcriptional regulator [Chloroflexia bacterium]|nr:Rrf2 family transcriptional regulator [Chloroflexia bacterium]